MDINGYQKVLRWSALVNYGWIWDKKTYELVLKRFSTVIKRLFTANNGYFPMLSAVLAENLCLDNFLISSFLDSSWFFLQNFGLFLDLFGQKRVI